MIANSRPVAPQQIASDPLLWRWAMEELGLGLWDWHVDTDKVTYSREYLAIIGYAEGELSDTAEVWVSRVHPDDLAAAETALDDHLTGCAEAYHSEHRLRCRNGHYKWVLERGRIIERTPDGKPLRVIGSLADIEARKTAELALRASERLFRQIFDNAPIGLALIDLDGRWHDVNRALCDMLGYAEQDLLEQTVTDLTHVDDRRAERELLELLRQDAALSVTQEKRYLHKSGAIIYAQVDTSLMRAEDGTALHLISQVQDVSQRRRDQDALFEEKELAQVTLSGIADAVIRCDASGRIRYCNEAATRLIGHAADELVGQPFDTRVRLYGERGGARIADPTADIIGGDAGDALPRFAQLETADGRRRPVECALTPLHGRHGDLLGSVIVFHDLTHTRLLSDQLVYQASHDPLTDLPNRREFEAELAHRLETARSSDAVHCVLYLDLDQFKLINDTCGHPVGDRLLRALAPELKAALPPQALLCRLGGDEFAAILPETLPESALAIAEQVSQAIRGFRFSHHDRSFQIGASIGISVVDTTSGSAEQVMSQADTACYIAKRRGRNRIQLYHGSDEDIRQAHADMDWASRIEEALADNRVELFAQRIVSIDGDGVPAYEILIRVQGEDGQLSPPSAFLGAANRFGLAGRIDRWVVRRTLEMLQTHIRLRGKLPLSYVSINLTGPSISDDQFARYLMRMLDRYAVPPECICFEITETAALSNLNRARDFVRNLRSRGYRILLDDFGSGFTSFDYLRTLEVDGLKIDMGYTLNLLSDPINQTIVEFICRICAQLRIDAIAEGVENQETLDALKRLGAHRAQGHLFHRAEPLGAVLDRPA